MKREVLEKLHKILLLIVDEIDRVCEKNNIKWSLIDGSMLGAIRHKGFIPWDDDVDIGMLSKDYVKLVSACEKDLDEQFILQTNLNALYYVYGFGKVLLKDTFFVQFGQENTKCKKEIFVDVFPYDNIPNDNKKRIKQRRIKVILAHLLRRKFGVSIRTIRDKKRKVVFLMGDNVNLFFNLKKLIEMLNRNMLLYSKDSTTVYVSAMSGFYGYDRETIPACYFDKVIHVPFEDRSYPIVSEYDFILTDYYRTYEFASCYLESRVA